MNLLDIQPHVVSRDLKGYSVMFYGDPKSGKTTTASKFPKSLIVAFEKGYAAIPGVMAMPVNNWGDFLKVLRQLKDPAVQERFETIVIDTADIAYDYCETYTCQVNGVSKIGEIPFGAGYGMVAKEFDTKLRQIVQMNYGLVLISHSQDKTFTNEQGVEYNRIVPTLPTRPRTICERLCDIIGYSRAVDTDEGTKTMLFMRGTTRFVAGSRFKYIPNHIEFNYSNLVDAICDAIDKEAEENGNQFVSDDAHNIYIDNTKHMDFDEVMAQFNATVKELISKDSSRYAPRITEIVENHLGKGKKVAECTRSQAPVIEIILAELQDLK